MNSLHSRPRTSRPSRRRHALRASAALVMATAIGVTASLPALASSLGPSNAQRGATARSSAKTLLALARVPQGSKPLATWIPADGHQLAVPMSTSLDNHQVDLSKFYLAPDTAHALAWIHHEKIDGQASSGTGSSSGPGSGNETDVTFSFATTSILSQRTVEYSLLPVAHGELEVRVDALVTYLAQKSRFAIVASGAVKVVVVVDRGLNAKHNRFSTYSSTNTKTIDELLTKVNDLPPALSPGMMCPADMGASVTLRFYRAGATTPYAVVVSDSGGCGPVAIDSYDALDAFMGSAHVAGGVALSAFVAKTFDIKTLVTY